MELITSNRNKVNKPNQEIIATNFRKVNVKVNQK